MRPFFFLCINECSVRCSLGPRTQREYNSVIEFWLDSTEPFATVSYKDGRPPFHSFLSLFFLLANLIMAVITVWRTRSGTSVGRAEPQKCCYLCLALADPDARSGWILKIEVGMVYVNMTYSPRSRFHKTRYCVMSSIIRSEHRLCLANKKKVNDCNETVRADFHF